MCKSSERGRVLVAGSEPFFLETIGGALKSQFDVLVASNEKEGLLFARKERPDAIVLGYMEPQGTAFRLHQKLRAGWITKHIPLLVVDLFMPGEQNKVWTSQEAMQMEADDYISVSPDDSASAVHLIQSVGLLERISDRLSEKANPLKEAIRDPNIFCVTWEQIPGRGAFEMQQEKIIDNVARAAQGGMIHAISVTDNPGGNPALSTEMLCAEIKKSGMEPLVHFSCRDKNRNEIESMLYGIAAEGVRNILVLTGDYPTADGFLGMPKPVFDLDPINMLRLVETINRGLEYTVMRKKVVLAPTDFFAGVCVSPFKKLESELMTQYYKLEKKIAAGARFIITQVGYDVRKLHELLQWLEVNAHDIPVFANIYILPHGTAKLMNANMIPGCIVTDKLVSELREERKTGDKGKSARLLRSAKQYAIAKGMGCAGAHIGGHGVTYDMVENIVNTGEELSEKWEDLLCEFDYPQRRGFYLFEKNPQTGLNQTELSERPRKAAAPMKYKLARIAHSLLFNEKGPLFKPLQAIAKRVDSSPRAMHALEFQEHIAKVIMFDCMNCGDCALFDVAYVCPMSQCPKEQRNGPCGGSYNGWCEVHPNEKKCVWVQAYERLKAYNEEDRMADHIVPPCNWDLRKTSSWLNFYLGRDHTAKRLGIGAS